MVGATNVKVVKIEANFKRYLGRQVGKKWRTLEAGGQVLVGNKCRTFEAGGWASISLVGNKWGTLEAAGWASLSG